RRQRLHHLAERLDTSRRGPEHQQGRWLGRTLRALPADPFRPLAVLCGVNRTFERIHDAAAAGPAPPDTSAAGASRPASSTSRTVRSRTAAGHGFCRNALSVSSTPWCAIASSG